MKALDTGVLLALLQGSRPARDALRKLRGTEIATTEVNLLELAFLAASSPSRVRSARLASLERLRRRLTVLPVDPRAVREAAQRLPGGPARPPVAVAAMLGALEGAGCEELLTDDPRLRFGEWGFRVRHTPI